MACPMRVASAPCILVTMILMRSKANTLIVSTDTEGPTDPPWIPEAPRKPTQSAGGLLWAPVAGPAGNSRLDEA